MNVPRFWKKFVHCDGSYGAGGRQGRYVFSWPAVRMILGFLFAPTRSDYCFALLSVTHSLVSFTLTDFSKQSFHTNIGDAQNSSRD